MKGIQQQLEWKPATLNVDLFFVLQAERIRNVNKNYKCMMYPYLSLAININQCGTAMTNKF